MATRDRFAEMFGPKLLEAIVEAMVEEFNRNRTWHGQPAITKEAVQNAIRSKCAALADYDFSANGP
jgi:hypothetical protein